MILLCVSIPAYHTGFSCRNQENPALRNRVFLYTVKNVSCGCRALFVHQDLEDDDAADTDDADQIRHNYDHDVTIYSANIPSQPAYIGDTSYVIADTAGVAKMVRIFMEGGDISQDIEASSISSEIAAAGGSSTPPATTNTGYYY